MTAPRACALDALDEDGRREYWATLALRNTAGLGARGIYLLLSYFGSAYTAVMNVPLWPDAGVPSQRAEGYLNNAWRVKARPEWDAARTLAASVILWNDKRYPALLRQLPDAPALLYALGDTSLLSSPCVAVIGSRNSSGQALNIVSSIAAGLSDAGVTVVSGMALGADGCAHRAALSGPGRTIAVLPGGVDRPFPIRHTDLYRRIAQHGLVISEMPPGTLPGPGAFPVRNRIISGLCLGVLVANAETERSGCLITARLAAEQGRNVYVTAPSAMHGICKEGTKKLLLEGARPVYGVGDMLSDLLPHLKASLNTSETRVEKRGSFSENTLPCAAPQDATQKNASESSDKKTVVHVPDMEKTKDRKHSQSPSSAPLTQEEQSLLDLLNRQGPLSPDDLLYAAQDMSEAWTCASVNAVLMILEVKKLVRRLSDARYEARS